MIDARADIASVGTAGTAVRGELAALTRRLAAERSGQLPASAVVCCVWGCAEELLRAGVRSGLLWATEAMARARLDRHPPATGVVPAVSG